MNKEIIRLARMAGLPVPGDPITPVSPKAVRKFAKLLIQDAASFVDSKTNSDECGVANAWCEGKDLLEFFGEKE